MPGKNSLPGEKGEGSLCQGSWSAYADRLTPKNSDEILGLEYENKFSPNPFEDERILYLTAGIFILKFKVEEV